MKMVILIMNITIKLLIKKEKIIKEKKTIKIVIINIEIMKEKKII